MSRKEVDRWKLGAERWPTLQSFISDRLGTRLAGPQQGLPVELNAAVAEVLMADCVLMATEYADWSVYFSQRYDEGRFLTDGFGVVDGHRLRDREGQARMKLLYDAVIVSVRNELGSDWKP